MTDTGKKTLIWVVVSAVVIAIAVVVTKAASKAKSTAMVAIRNGALFTNVALPPGLSRDVNGNIITIADGAIVKTFDANTGAYQESDGTWYSYEGLPLMYYDTTNGNYIEESDPTTLYNKQGEPI